MKRYSIFIVIVVTLLAAAAVFAQGVILDTYDCTGGRIFVTPEAPGDQGVCAAFTETPTPTDTPTATATATATLTPTATPTTTVHLPVIHYLSDTGVVLDGNDVDEWQDQSGNGYNAGPGNNKNSLRPSLVTNELNSLPVLRFSDDVLASENPLSAGGTGTVIWVTRLVTTTVSNPEPNFWRLHDDGCNNGKEREASTFQPNQVRYTFQYRVCDIGTQTMIQEKNVYVSADLSWHYFVFRFAGELDGETGVGVMNVRVDGEDAGTQTGLLPVAGSPDEALIAAKTPNGAHGCPCDFAEYRLYDSYLSVAEIEVIEAEIRNKWGF